MTTTSEKTSNDIIETYRCGACEADMTELATFALRGDLLPNGLFVQCPKCKMVNLTDGFMIDSCPAIEAETVLDYLDTMDALDFDPREGISPGGVCLVNIESSIIAMARTRIQAGELGCVECGADITALVREIHNEHPLSLLDTDCPAFVECPDCGESNALTLTLTIRKIPT